MLSRLTTNKQLLETFDHLYNIMYHAKNYKIYLKKYFRYFMIHKSKIYIVEYNQTSCLPNVATRSYIRLHGSKDSVYETRVINQLNQLI